MAYNRKKEYKKWIIKKEREEKTLKEQGVTEEYLVKLRELDKEMFNQDRRFNKHNVITSDRFFICKADEKLKEYSKKNKRILLLDFNNYIKGQSSFTDNINHYQRIVYYEASHKANEYIENSTGSKVQEKEYNKLFFAYDQLKTNLKRKINRNSIIYKITSRIYFNLRKK